MRYALAALIALPIATAPAAAENAPPTQDCTRAFVAKWRQDKVAAMSALPSRPCWMHTSTGDYVCYQDGCVRDHVYLSDD